MSERESRVWITTGREYAFGGDGAAAFGPEGQLNGGLPIGFADLFQSAVGGPVSQGVLPPFDQDAILSLGRETPVEDLASLGLPDDILAELKAQLLTAALEEKEPSKLEKLGKALAVVGKLDKKKGKGKRPVTSSLLGEAVPGGIPETPPPPDVLAQGKAARGIPPAQPGVPFDLANLTLLRSLFRPDGTS